MIDERVAWYRTDQWIDTAPSLEHLNESLRLLPEKADEWKWAILACHSALQGILICVLSGSSGMGCLDNKSMARVFEWIERSRTDFAARAPRERLAELPVLLSRSRDPNFMAEFGGMPMPIDGDADRDILLLHNLRNQFVHFAPRSWSVELGGLPRIVAVAMTFGARILFGHPACTYRLDRQKMAVFASHFASIAERLELLGQEGISGGIRNPRPLIRMA
jgi:hypothetical protein